MAFKGRINEINNSQLNENWMQYIYKEIEGMDETNKNPMQISNHFYPSPEV